MRELKPPFEHFFQIIFTGKSNNAFGIRRFQVILSWDSQPVILESFLSLDSENRRLSIRGPGSAKNGSVPKSRAFSLLTFKTFDFRMKLVRKLHRTPIRKIIKLFIKKK